MNTLLYFHPHLAPHLAGRLEDLERPRVCPSEHGGQPAARDLRESLVCPEHRLRV
ncbi:hypothetical protein [Deinococcus hopiensis]|uniref:hypothetical protein n=1 Tax=Deinococcus hopiensis TaxID=309885 RepID=UPI00148399E8|nr:hypothetical protein [Deinococcus hopiensis]